MTYRELDAQVEAIRARLADVDLGPDRNVAVLAFKSPRTIAAMQAVVRQHAVYVPLDPRAPAERLAAVAAAARVRCVLLDGGSLRHAVALAASGATSTIDIGVVSASPSRSHDAPPPARRDELAYILFTSGSTGEPKGVMISHGNALAFVEWASRKYGISCEDRLLCHAPLTFDLPVFDIYATFAAGACLVLVPDLAALFPEETARIIHEGRVTSLFMVPSAIVAAMNRGGLVRTGLPELRNVLYSGEAFPIPPLSRLRAIRPDLAIANLYGPIETNACTSFDVRQVPDGATAVPIGTPTADTTISLRDTDGIEVRNGATRARFGYPAPPSHRAIGEILS